MPKSKSKPKDVPIESSGDAKVWVVYLDSGERLADNKEYIKSAVKGLGVKRAIVPKEDILDAHRYFNKERQKGRWS